MGEVLGWLGENIVELSLIVALIAAVVLLIARLRTTSARASETAAGARQLQARMDAVEAAGDALILTGSGDRCLYANPASAALFGYGEPSALFGKTWRALIADSDTQRMETQVIPTLKKSGRWVGSLRGKTGKGDVVPLDVSISGVRGGYLFVLRNRRAADDEGDGDPMRFESLVNSSANALVLLSGEFKILEWNPEAERQLARKRNDVLRSSFPSLFDPENRDRVEEQLHSVLQTRERKSFEATPVAPQVDGEPAWDDDRAFLWNVTYVPHDQRGQLACVGQDVTGIKATEEEFSRQEHLYRMLANNSSDLVGVHDLEGTFTYVSPSCTTLLGYTQEELVGRDPYQLSTTEDWKGVQQAMAAARTGRHTRTSLRFRNSAGVYTWFEMSVRPLYDNLGAIVQIQTSSRDISEQKAVEAQLSHQAFHEPLTGLPNRSLFLDRLRHAMTLAKRSGGQLTVMFMDLDRFKIINDSMGHEAGDRLIQAVARRLTDVLRDGDTVARLGGDEFGVLLEYGISQDDAEIVAQRILDAIEPPFTFSGQEMYVSASVGIAFSSPEVEDPEDLLRYADVAMYRAKSEGPGKYRIFDPEVDSDATGRLAMETDLRQAIDREQLFNTYQPIVSLTTGRISALEALVRWRHPSRGLVGPDEFIPVAEETGLIVPLGYLVTRRACEALKVFQQIVGSKRDLVVAVNLSTKQFEQPDLEREIMSILAETDTAPEHLRIEITESELMRDTGRIGQLRSKGLQIAIDDFGTGYSSLAYLRNIEADSLKIDRLFVDGLGAHSQDDAIVRTVVTLARELEMDVTAEGIETAEQLALLREIGVDSGQGFFLARPAPAEEIADLLREDPTW
ncbi:MAG: EAL domain-containing protein [Gemmatimonadota bacterium]|nr:EAL domain-containing protein [Gemmatimonadota bacterium]